MDLKINAAGLTDVGRKRDHNEDSILVQNELHLYAVADGMGGHAAGEVASHTAIETMKTFVVGKIAESKAQDGTIELNEEAPVELSGDDTTDPGIDTGETAGESEDILRAAVTTANREIYQMARTNQEYVGMGTTLAVIYLSEKLVHFCHVGDSRIYLYREGQLEALTQDHSWVNEQLRRKIITEEEARNHQWRNVITRALGNNAQLEVDLGSMETRPDDLFLICSDGLTGMLEDEAIARQLAGLNGDLEKACHEFVLMANEAGGSDNISVVLIQIEP